MADFAESLRFGRGKLDRRWAFLTHRAEWHERSAQPADTIAPDAAAMHLACAATLWRDAGAVALLLGNIGAARDDFRRAAKQWLSLGFFEGVFLLRLSGREADVAFDRPDPHAWIEASLGDFDRIFETSADEPERRFARVSARSPRQLVSLIQASPNGAAARAAERLGIYAAYPLGPTQTPASRYLALLRTLRDGEPELGAETLTGMAIRRNELIDAAMRDEYHWQMALKPAELIDFDMLALGLAALERGEDVYAATREIIGQRGPIALLPFDLAPLLELPRKFQ